MRAVAVVAAFFALAVSARAAVWPTWWHHPKPTVAVQRFWDRVAYCETSSRWDWGAEHRPAEGHVYEGGVGFYFGTYATWARELGLYVRYPHAYLAPRLVQIAVAEYGYTVHNGFWGSIEDGCA